MHLYAIFPNRKVNVLRTFARMSSNEHQYHDGSIPNINSLMLDSGVFTANYAKSGDYSHVTLENYIKHLQNNKDRYEYYANFDLNFTSQGAQQNLQALRQMEKSGLKPYPVIHDYFMGEIED